MASMTIKLTEEDARFIAVVLENVAKLRDQDLRQQETVPELRALEFNVNTPHKADRLKELAAFFNVSIRASGGRP